MNFSKGFTLLELLIVIGILAILAAVVVLVLNPAELLRQARDSQRISDLATIKSALGLYLGSVKPPGLSLGTACPNQCYVNVEIGSNGCGGRHSLTKAPVYKSSRTLDGNGWVPVRFIDIPGGAPLSVLPKDPKNNATYFYSYACDMVNYTFELNVDMESERYSGSASSDNVEKSDGGNKDEYYEVGSDPALNL